MTADEITRHHTGYGEACEATINPELTVRTVGD